MKSFRLELLLFISALIISTKTMSAEKDLYDFLWLDPDKKVYVLQNKIHKKEHTFYANIGVGTENSSSFQETNLLHGNIGYFFNEEWAIESFYSKYKNKDNDALENLKRLNGSIPFIRKANYNMGLLISWSPFYGKINTFNKIFYFDWSIGLGIGKIETESNAQTVANPTTADIYKKEKYTTYLGKSEVTFHANKNINIGIGVILNNYNAPGPTVSNKEGANKMRSNLDTLLTVGYSF